ncbi:MAG: TolC family protein [Bacteroidota bacterium]|nr:TolC family protein [Bacteroidota bacterium]
MKLQTILISLSIIFASGISAQEKPQQWNLANCIEYALKNNIQIQQSKVTLETSLVTTKQAKAQLLPNLSAGITQSFSNNPFTPANVYSGSYAINSSLLLFDGRKTGTNIREQKLTEQANQYAVLASEKSIQLSILQSYLQILYADESVKINKATLDVSKFQLERGQSLLKAGSISKTDLAQLESQYSTDKYQLVTAENSLSSMKVQLKQLLELSVTDELNIVIPELNEVDVLKPLSSLQSIYENSLNVMPALKSSKLNIQMAGLETRKAKAGYLPTVSLNASVGTNHSTVSSFNFGNQLRDGFNEGIGLSVSIPIFTNRQTKSTVEKAVLNEKTSKLNLQDAEKSLLKEIESAYQDALSAQSQYLAAEEKVKALQTSYDLIDQQYKLGMKNTLELLTEKNNLLAAQQNLLQAKYLSLMNGQMLNLYQDLPLEIQ